MNHIINYLQSPNGLRMTAFVASSIILIAFVHRLLKREKRFTLVMEQPSPQWYASECFMFLRATIMTCSTPNELKKCREQVEAFYDREFRAPITRAERKRYYARLLEAIALKDELINQTISA